MRIIFQQQNVTEMEKQHSEAVRANHHGTKAAATAQGAVYAENSQNFLGGSGRIQKGKSLIELQREADGADVTAAQDYMTLMSHTMSEEDYAKLQEDGFDFRSMDPEKAVTIVDRIKAELVRSGKEIKGYTDNVDIEALAEVLGSQVLASAVADSFRTADIPLTEENLELVAKAWSMTSELKPMDDGANSYMIDNELEPEIWNLYLAQNSGAKSSGGNAPKYIAEDVQGYYARNGEPDQSSELAEQIDRVIVQSGREINEENRQNAAWLLENGLPLTEENLDRLEELKSVSLPVMPEDFAKASADAISEGKDPIHANLSTKSENLYEKAARLAEYYQSDEAWDILAGDLAARRLLEEIRLRMTAEVNVKLLKSGFSIDTAPMEQLVEALRQAEREVAEQYFPEDSQAVEKYRSFNAANNVVAELPGLPAQVLGTFAEGQAAETLEEFHREGKVVQDTYNKAQESYETLMTAPRANMGDSTRKAFANVDDIVRDLGIEPAEETRRATRIGTFAESQATEPLEEFHREGKAVQDTYNKAQESYETLMTAPRADMGDSPRKAFANVDDNVRDLGIESAEEPRRAARIGTFAEGQAMETLEEFHSEGKEVQDTYNRAQESYEILMTAPRADMGDSIRKAFANVDDILRDLGVEPTEETRRAARILGYNRMEMTTENLATVMEADRQVKSVIEKLTPAATLKMIRDGINPLEKNFAELEDYFERMPEEYRRETESYSRFLYGLERNKEITQEERDSYIGIYRLLSQIERSDGAVVGALVNIQAELHFSNLLSAVRSGKVRSVDVKVADQLGVVAELVRKGESISDQIGRAFAQDVGKVLTEVSYSEEAEAAYRQEELEQLRQAVAEADAQCTALLERGQMSANVDNLLTAQALAVGVDNLFAPIKKQGSVRQESAHAKDENVTKTSQTLESAEAAAEKSDTLSAVEKSDFLSDESEFGMTEASGSKLWEALDTPETFAEAYETLTKNAMSAVEDASLMGADTSLDVRSLQLAHKQLTVMGALAKKEEYFIPMYVGDVLTRVHLTLEHSAESGMVSVGVQTSREERLEARFRLEEGELNGIFISKDQNEVMKLEELADTFKEEAGGIWKVGRIDITDKQPAAARVTTTADSQRTESAELYRVAKVFLQSVQKRGI